jgi:hypothetical protein
MNLILQTSTLGSMLLKIQSFLVFQMLQTMMIIISMKNGTPKFLLIRIRIWGTGLEVATEIPIEAQQALAKLHLRKR